MGATPRGSAFHDPRRATTLTQLGAHEYRGDFTSRGQRKASKLYKGLGTYDAVTPARIDALIAASRKAAVIRTQTTVGRQGVAEPRLRESRLQFNCQSEAAGVDSERPASLCNAGLQRIKAAG